MCVDLQTERGLSEIQSYCTLKLYKKNEPPHDKMACGPSLIRVFAVRMKKAWVLSYPLSALRRRWSDWADAQYPPSLIWVFAERTVILLVLSRGGSNVEWSWYILQKFRLKKYRNFPKYSDTQTICCNHSKIWTMWLYHRVMSPNGADGMANSVDPDQTAPLGAL